MLEMIFAMRKDGSIGKGDKLLYHIKEDLKHFKDKTMGKVCVMGRKTYESLPKSKLPNREIIILTRDKSYKGLYGEEICSNIEDIISLSKKKDVMICGGKEIYDYFLPYCNQYYITIINDFKEYDEDDKDLVKLEKDDYFNYNTYKTSDLIEYNKKENLEYFIYLVYKNV